MTGHQRVLSTQLIYGGRNITLWTSEMIFAMHIAVESRGSEVKVSAAPPARSFSARRGCRVRLVWGASVPLSSFKKLLKFFYYCTV